MKILSYLKDKNIKKFICFTTVLLYDQKKMTLPVSENQSINPYINDYVFSKYLSEQIVKLYEKYVPSIVVRLSNIYGYTKLRRPDLVPTIMQDIFSKERVSIWSDLPKRDFIFTEDAANAVLKLLDVDFTGILNLGTGKMNSIKQISEIIENLSGKKIISENKRVSGPLEFITDISKIKKIVDWSPKYSLEKGLKKTFEIMKNY
jgi:nucleoside-diphosphate-sugar epimerase